LAGRRGWNVLTDKLSSDNLLIVINLTWFEIFSDLLVNLAAGWFGAVIIVPNFSGINPPFNLLILTGNVLAGILSLVAAFKLRRLSKEEL